MTPTMNSTYSAKDEITEILSGLEFAADEFDACGEKIKSFYFKRVSFHVRSFLKTMDACENPAALAKKHYDQAWDMLEAGGFSDSDREFTNLLIDTWLSIYRAFN